MSEGEPSEHGAEKEPAAPAEPSEPSEPTAPPGAESPAAGAPPAAASAASRRRLTRSREDRVIAGVCGGVAEYFGVDTVLVRIAALVLLFAGGAGFFLYVIGWIAIPEAPETPLPGGPAAAAPRPAVGRERTGGALALGLLFVAVGVYFLLDKAFPDLLAWEWIWPIALIVIGAAVILRARR